ncbi:unnamed protein product [Heterobilharzia americana]|nr:unnamed protein product [Heterobilharzia americana]
MKDFLVIIDPRVTKYFRLRVTALSSQFLNVTLHTKQRLFAYIHDFTHLGSFYLKTLSVVPPPFNSWFERWRIGGVPTHYHQTSLFCRL